MGPFWCVRVPVTVTRLRGAVLLAGQSRGGEEGHARGSIQRLLQPLCPEAVQPVQPETAPGHPRGPW